MRVPGFLTGLRLQGFGLLYLLQEQKEALGFGFLPACLPACLPVASMKTLALAYR